MKIHQGATAVRQHADKAGLTEGIIAIVKAFGKDSIKDIEIHADGEVSVIHELSHQNDRVIPGVKSDITTKDAITATRAHRR